MNKLQTLSEKLYRKTYKESNGHRAQHIKKGVPDARYNKSYKYTVYYCSTNFVAGVYKSLKEIEKTYEL